MSEDPKTLVRAGVGSDVAPVQVVTMPAWQMIAIRAARTYIQCLIGFLGATPAATALGIPLPQFGNQFVVAASLAVAPTVVAILMNLAEVLTNLDVSQPSLRA